MQSHNRRLTIAVAFGAATIACGARDGNASFSTADSSGVLIATNSGPTWSSGEEWTISRQPTIDIGTIDGAPEFQLYRVANAVRMGDGNIVVANAGTQEIRCYDSSGGHLWSAGGEGGGPGEFEGLYRIALYTDSIVAFDSRHSRVSVFDKNGGYSRSTTLGDPRGVLQSVFGDGTLLITDSDIRNHLRRRVLGEREEIDDGNVRLTDVAMRHSPAGEFLDSLGIFPGAEGKIDVRTSGEAVSVAFSYRPFGRTTVFAVHGNKLLAGTQDEYEVGIYSSNGDLESLVRRDLTNRIVSERDIGLLRDEYLDGLTEPEERRARINEFESLAIPEIMPAFGRIMVDSDGFLWVEEYHTTNEVPEWTVFDHENRMLGTIEVPGGLEVQQIGRDFVLGTWTDDVDVEHVRLYGLSRQ